MIYTMPWYTKAALVGYDVFRCWIVQQDGANPDTDRVFQATCSVFGLQTMVTMLLVAPSVCVSVSDRVETNKFCCNVLLLLSTYLLLLRCMRTGIVSAEDTCFLLQFGSSYFFSCFYESTSKRPMLLVGRSFVRLASAGCILLFPVLYSHIIPNCMHVSPYALAFVFSGEVCGCLCFVASHLVCALEIAIDAVYTRAMET